MRAVLDPNVLISAVISSRGAPAELLIRWRDGEFELVISAELIDELTRVLNYPKLRALISADDGSSLVELLAKAGSVVTPDGPASVESRDPDDAYLLALSSTANAYLVSGDAHLLELRDRIPVESPREFLNRLQGA